MTRFAEILSANERYVASLDDGIKLSERRSLAVVTCMDARIDVFAALGLELGEAYVIRNAGARVTEDVLRSLTLCAHVLGVSSVIVMQHTNCGLEGVSDEELRSKTGAVLEFLPIADHPAAINADIDTLAAQPFLSPIVEIAGFLFDIETGQIIDITRWRRS